MKDSPNVLPLSCEAGEGFWWARRFARQMGEVLASLAGDPQGSEVTDQVQVLNEKLKEEGVAETVEELTANYEEDGVLKVKELDKYVLTKGAWATVMFLYQDFDRVKDDYGPKKVTIRRFQKRDGEYAYRSKFNISSIGQAKMVVDALEKLIAEEEG